MSYKYGITGFVELSRDTAKKYSYFDNFYWLKEYAVLLYTWPYETTNIIKHNHAAFVNVKAPNKKEPTLCYELAFPRYRKTLDEIKFYKDSEIIQILLDLLSGLTFLHKKSIMHRDLKPANIMVNDAGQAIIIDFSHSHRIRTKAFTLDKDVATISHRPPEIFAYARGEIGEYDEKIDMWSIGIILFEMVTGLKSYETIASGTDTCIEVTWLDELYMSKIKNYYDKRKTPFLYNKIYWKWITDMLVDNPKKRISAADMFSIVRKFAIDNNIPFIMPSNGAKNMSHVKGRKNTTQKNEDAADKKILHEQCMSYLSTYRETCGFKFVLSKMEKLIDWFINVGCVTKTNYVTYTLALAVIIDITIYDNLLMMPDISEIDISIARRDLELAIMDIIQKFDKELFLYGTFEFSEDVNVVNEKIDDEKNNEHEKCNDEKNNEHEKCNDEKNNEHEELKIGMCISEYESDVPVIYDTECEIINCLSSVDITDNYCSENEYSNIEVTKSESKFIEKQKNNVSNIIINDISEYKTPVDDISEYDAGESDGNELDSDSDGDELDD
jgi:serine/threonine protein kinase